MNTLSDVPRQQRWHEQKFPAPAAVAITIDHSQRLPHYLLIKRLKNPYAGSWALVGGKWEFGETLVDAIIREVKEEADLDATFVAMRGLVSERVIPQKQNQKAAHFIIFVCELTASGKPQEQDEGLAAWFTLDEIHALNTAATIIPSDYQMIRSFVMETADTTPYYEAEMRAPLDNADSGSIDLLRFERMHP